MPRPNDTSAGVLSQVWGKGRVNQMGEIQENSQDGGEEICDRNTAGEMQEVWGDPGPAARFCASIPTLRAKVDAKGDKVVSVCRVGDKAADETNAIGRAGARDSARVGEVIWLRGGIPAAGCDEALCDGPVSGE